ncbi:MAG: bifunctional NADH dehydrogenase FAD-containing subunit/selenide, water dikinase SelD, partial [Planctomycetes bacterium]|nr:bifunctional NADH dehydrogenase FAD-containing subunit/selenide, water dikinase SelD [Planctomycetota bacterium]
MTPQAIPLSRDLVLVGGGHTHALVLRMWGMDPLPGARLTVIDPNPTAPYSGMLPGMVAGHYARADLEIDLVRLARFAGARLVVDAASSIDAAARRITLGSGREIGYDVASLDVGIHARMPSLPGFVEHGVPVKPLDDFAGR